MQISDLQIRTKFIYFIFERLKYFSLTRYVLRFRTKQTDFFIFFGAQNIHSDIKAMTGQPDGLCSIKKHKIKNRFSLFLFVCFFIASFFHVNNPIMLIFCKLFELQRKDKQHRMKICFCF